MAQIAIKGHPTRGKEIIEILEMLGGKNTRDYICNMPDYAYSINEQGMIEWFMSHLNSSYTIFTLEEFLEKFPYKIGNKVIAYTEGILAQFTIQDIRWNDELNKIEYRICSSWLDAGLMWLYKEKKEETMEEKNNDNWVKWDLPDGYEFQDEEGNVIKADVIKLVKKQPQYPKTYEECCKVLMGKTDFQDYSLLLTKLSTKINEANSISPEPPHITLINNFYQLLICRDAYWKIAGEEMGLGEPWKPTDDEFSHIKYVIQTTGSKITCLDTWCKTKNILELPTAEMRDIFYKNFKKLIECCKELL